MTNLTFKAIAAAAVIGTAALTVAPPAEAGRGYRGGHHYRGGGGGDALAAGIIGLGVGAIIGSALTPREVYVTPPPPPRAYYGAASYGGPEPWTPGWYRYCRALHGPYFDANSGYYQGGDGGVYFCR